MTYPNAEPAAAGGDMQPVINAAQTAVARYPVPSDADVLSVVLPAGAGHHVLDLEEIRAQYRDHPRRKRGTVRVHDAPSFFGYYVKHSSVARSELYADTDARSLLAVLDGHAGDTPGWCEHRLLLQLRTTPEWRHWAGKDRRAMTQVEFAEHIEDGLPYIVAPSGGVMLEIAETFQAKSKVQFTSGSRLKDGQRQLIYTEDTTAAAGQRGDIVIPDRFTLGLAPFEGVDGYQITARLRYRIDREGQLTLTYLLDEPHKVLRDAFRDVLGRIETELGVTALHGAPA